MASTSALRTRRSAAQLQAIRGVERQLRATDPNSRRKYLQDFSQAFRSYESVLDRARLPGVFAESDILLIGDYHALPASQRYAASVIRELGASPRPLVVGVETVFARDQRILDEWWFDEIEEGELRERLRFDLDWGYEWVPFFEVMTAARDNAQAIYGLDCMPREDLRKIGARDRHAAAMIAEIRDAHPGARIVVLIGESHLAPNHLPRLLRQRLGGERICTVLQNVDSLYWRAAGEAHDRVEAVRVAEDILCVFNATPLEKYESYRLCLERWGREDVDAPDLSPTIYNLIYALLRFLGINLYSPHNTTQPKFLVDSLPVVYAGESDALLRRLLGRKGLPEPERNGLLQRIEECGCAYLPHGNAFYIRDFQMVHAAEEAARFLHHACQGLLARRTGAADAGSHKVSRPEDQFYARALENVVAYFGSRVLNPARPPLRESEFYEMYDLTREDVEQHTVFGFAEFIRMIDFLTRHRGLELKRDRQALLPEEAQRFDAEQGNYLSRQLGYMLGSDLYDAYLEGRVSRRFLKQLLLTHLDDPGTAAKTYFTVVRKVRAADRECREK